MNDIEKTPRERAEALIGEVLTAALSAGEITVNQARAVNAALEAALVPPDGHVPAAAVLAAATRLRRLASAASPLGRKAYIKAAEDIELTVSAARPEVQ